jgi:hypothetical protein
LYEFFSVVPERLCHELIDQKGEREVKCEDMPDLRMQNSLGVSGGIDYKKYNSNDKGG